MVSFNNKRVVLSDYRGFVLSNFIGSVLWTREVVLGDFIRSAWWARGGIKWFYKECLMS